MFLNGGTQSQSDTNRVFPSPVDPSSECVCLRLGVGVNVGRVDNLEKKPRGGLKKAARRMSRAKGHVWHESGQKAGGGEVMWGIRGGEEKKMKGRKSPKTVMSNAL